MRLSPAEMPSLRSVSTWKNARLIEKAWALPVAKLYAPLLSQGITSLCGPTSVANVLRSMGLNAAKNPLRGFGVRPMSVEQLANEAAEVVPDPWRAVVVRPATSEEFRTELRSSNDELRRYVVNFARVPLFGGGSGHHSPIGGYLEEEDLVFVLDVNAGFGPWLVSPERLFEATNTVADWANGKKRDLARFER